MLHPLGTVLEVVLRFSGDVTSPTGTLYVGGSASGATVTCTASGDEVVASVATTGLSDLDRVYIEVDGTVDGESETQRSATRVLYTQLPANVTHISGDSDAADNLEKMLDGTGGKLTLADPAGSGLVIHSAGSEGAVQFVVPSGGPALYTIGAPDKFIGSFDPMPLHDDWTTARAAKLDNLDAAVTTRLAGGTPLSGTQPATSLADGTHYTCAPGTIFTSAAGIPVNVATSARASIRGYPKVKSTGGNAACVVGYSAEFVGEFESIEATDADQPALSLTNNAGTGPTANIEVKNYIRSAGYDALILAGHSAVKAHTIETTHDDADSNGIEVQSGTHEVRATLVKSANGAAVLSSASGTVLTLIGARVVGGITCSNGTVRLINCDVDAVTQSGSGVVIADNDTRVVSETGTVVRVEVDANATAVDSVAASTIWSYGTRTLTAGPSIASPAQQYGSKVLIAGDTYSSTGRSWLITMASGAEWPTDLSEYSWACTIVKAEGNDNADAPDTITATVAVVTATGSSRALRITTTPGETCVGPYDFEIVGTKSGSGEWTVELGVALVKQPGAVQ